MKHKRTLVAVLVFMILASVAYTFAQAADHHIASPEGFSRRYALFVPTAPADGVPLPLVVALHQFSDTAKGMENLTGFNELAEKEGFLVAYPQGRFRIWNAGQLNCPDDIAFISAMIDAISKDYPVDPSRIYAVGASAGGMMAQWLACNSHRFAAIATVMGSQPKNVLDKCVPQHPTPCLVLHGDEDPIIPFTGGETFAGPGNTSDFLSAEETAKFWARINGCDANIETSALPVISDKDETRISLHTFSKGADKKVYFYKVSGGGHTWPGRDNWYPEFIVGETSMQLDATRVIWDFFKEMRLQQ